jgi:hypothetical protein
MPSIGNTQMVWGIVTFNTDNVPTPIAGTGNFQVVRGGTGLFNVVFDSTVAFSSTPTVAVTQIFNGGGNLNDIDPTGSYGGGNSKDNAVLIAVSTTQFRLITGDQFGNKQDRMFCFLVVGPGTQSVSDASKQVAYGNIGYEGGKINLVSQAGGVQLQQWGDNKWIAPSTSGTEPGVYGILPGFDSVDYFALVAQQIYAGQNNSSTIDNFTYDGGNTQDNAVADSISVAGNLNIITAGDENGKRQARMLGFIAIGG